MGPAMNRLYFRALLLSVCDTGAKLGDGFSERLHQNRQERRLTKSTQHFQRPVLGRCDTSSRSCARTDCFKPAAIFAGLGLSTCAVLFEALLYRTFVDLSRFVAIRSKDRLLLPSLLHSSSDCSS